LLMQHAPPAFASLRSCAGFPICHERAAFICYVSRYERIGLCLVLRTRRMYVQMCDTQGEYQSYWPTSEYGYTRTNVSKSREAFDAKELNSIVGEFNSLRLCQSTHNQNCFFPIGNVTICIIYTVVPTMNYPLIHLGTSTRLVFFKHSYVGQRLIFSLRARGRACRALHRCSPRRKLRMLHGMRKSSFLLGARAEVRTRSAISVFPRRMLSGKSSKVFAKDRYVVVPEVPRQITPTCYMISIYFCLLQKAYSTSMCGCFPEVTRVVPWGAIRLLKVPYELYSKPAQSDQTWNTVPIYTEFARTMKQP
jgi:hypothetical protein